jgi:hypothetical protein
MFEIAGFFVLFLAVAGAVVLCLGLLAGLLKLVFDVALVPVALAVGLVKLIVLPILFLIGLIVMVTVGPVLLALAAVFGIPLLVLGGVVWAACAALA